MFFNNKFSSSQITIFRFLVILVLLSKIIFILWTIFITVGIWRSAENYKGSIIWIVLTFFFLSYRFFTFRLIFLDNFLLKYHLRILGLALPLVFFID